MAVIKTTNPKVSTLKQGIKYITNPEKTEFITGKDCTAGTALEEMQTTKALYNKTEGRQYMHFVQSFKPDDPLDPSKAHQIGLEMAEKRFKGYEVLVATHTDKDHLHNHLIVNSVSFETGAKYQNSKNDLKAIKEISEHLRLSALIRGRMQESEKNETSLTKKLEESERLRNFEIKRLAQINTVLNERMEKLEKVNYQKLERASEIINEEARKTQESNSKIIREVMDLAHQVKTIPNPNWKERAKQYGTQLLITVGLATVILGVFRLVIFLMTLLKH